MNTTIPVQLSNKREHKNIPTFTVNAHEPIKKIVYVTQNGISQLYTIDTKPPHDVKLHASNVREALGRKNKTAIIFNNDTVRFGNDSNFDGNIVASGEVPGAQFLGITTPAFIIVTKDNQFYAQGSNTHNAIGDSLITQSNDDNNITHYPAVGKNLQNKKIIDFQAGDYHCLVLTNDGLVFSVGYNSNGEQGTDSGMTVPFYTHMNLFHGRSVKEIYAGDFMSMFRTDDDKIHCCGCNERGSMGIGITAATFAIREMKVLDTRFGVYDEPAHVKSIFVGGYHRFLVTDNNVVFAAGFNSEGECFVEGNDVMVYAKSNVLTEFANMQPSKELVIGSTFGFSVALLIRMLLLKLLTHKSK